LERCTFGLGPQKVIELAYCFGQIDEVGILLLRVIAQLSYFIDSYSSIIDEWPSRHFWIADRVCVDLRSTYIGIHDFKVAFRNISGSGRGRDQVRPRIPMVDKRFDLNILPEKD
jgi:hypothetical protein